MEQGEHPEGHDHEDDVGPVYPDEPSRQQLRQEGLGDELEAIAWSESGVLMGMRHRTLPYWGVQFHPESVLTTEGPLLLENFMRLCGENVENPGGPE